MWVRQREREGGGDSDEAPPASPPSSRHALVGSLLLSESFSLLDGEQQLLLQLLKALVGGEVQPVKAGGKTNAPQGE